MEAQLQIRRNAQEAQDQAQDLLRWTKQQQAKEAQLKESRSANGSRKAAPMRSGFSFKQPAPVSDQSNAPVKTQQSSATHPAGHTYDNYSKRWDNFDPDKVTSAAPEAEIRPASQAQNQAAREEDLAASMQRKQNQPKQPEANLDDLEWKERGNELFKKGNFAEAKTAYSRSLSKKRSAVVYANRAQACLKLGQAAQADKDCSEALELDMQNIKAWQRRGTARKTLGNHFGAAEDFEQVNPASYGYTFTFVHSCWLSQKICTYFSISCHVQQPCWVAWGRCLVAGMHECKGLWRGWSWMSSLASS